MDKGLRNSVVLHIREKKPTLEELQGLVGGLIQFAYTDDNIQIICNEEGKMKGLPVNREATLYWADWVGRIPDDILVGDVVILHGKAKVD